MSLCDSREYSGDHRYQVLPQAEEPHPPAHPVPGHGGPVAGHPGPPHVSCVRGAGYLGVWPAPLLHLADHGHVDLHLLHPQPGGHQHGQVHSSHPGSQVPHHHHTQEVTMISVIHCQISCMLHL